MQQPSGKFIVRIEPELHRQLQQVSQKKGVSLNQFCANQLRRAVTGSDKREDFTSCGISLSGIRSSIEQAGLPILGCVLFGSVSRGEATERSDIDLLLVLPSDLAPTRELYAQWDEKVRPILKETVAREVSPQFASLPTSALECGSLWFEVSLEGVLLWEQTSAVASCLSALRKAITSGAIERKLSHGQPFWVRKS